MNTEGQVFDGRAVTIAPYLPHQQREVGELVLSIQRQEFGVEVTLDDQPDLKDIPGFFQKGAGQFWCAVVDGRVIGSIGLLDLGHRAVALRKMFVHSGFRGGKGQSVAQQLLNQAEAWCRSMGIEEVLLGTIDRYAAACRFYERNNFQQVPEAELPKYFPKMKIDNRFYRKLLPPSV